MLRLRSIDKFPPLGWTFYQAETGWRAPAPLSTSFSKTVSQIIAHRRLNPGFPLSTSADAVSFELEQFTALRLKDLPHYVYSTDPAQPVAHTAPQMNAPKRCKTCP